MSYLFVYGTLMPGQENHQQLASIAGSWHKATVRGRLFPNGIGKALGYPALVLNEQAETIHGYVLSASDLDQHWQRLDAFEGDAYRRVKTAVVIHTQQHVEAYVYVLNESVKHE